MSTETMIGRSGLGCDGVGFWIGRPIDEGARDVTQEKQI